MDINSARLIFFSPTETTARIVDGIAQGIRPDIVNSIDLTPPENRSRDFEEMRDELAIIGTPVYGGRIPREAAHRLRQIKGNNTPAVIIVVYGNREYEDALLELRDIVTDLGFVPIAGGAFIGEHSYDSENTPIATGRPDPQDIEKAKQFGESIQEKIGKIRTLDDMPPLNVPGDFPYKKWDPPSDMAPITVEALCTLCGECATVCPTAAITVGDAVVTDPKECIYCSACVKKCPTGARVWDSPWIEQVTKRLSANCRERKEPQIYL
ncbi:MAG: 4Fe-4S binding protein [Deltaproteobacteria bacterium]|nr:4Fe-4S binding protein [Deltaproteobacteria bacterium]MBW2351319.1 4Fe-4S binding protein [Deltaproteobacteria bacterium]